MSILFKWSYYRTIQIEEDTREEPRVQEVIPPVLLKNYQILHLLHQLFNA